MKVQLNHPGRQKKLPRNNNLSSQKGFINSSGQIIRLWNSDKSHYRKFICSKGKYVKSINDIKTKESELYYWGEWEGHSRFEPINNSSDKRIFPNGIHYPLHTILNRGTQNTDPYIFGNEFKYAECKQRGRMCDLEENDLILFGSVFLTLECFYIDTVFVVDNYEVSKGISNNNAVNYTHIYKEATLEQLGNTYLNQTVVNKKKVYKGKKYSVVNKKYFSFVPCKINIDNSVGFERLKIDFSEFNKFGFSKNPTGVSYLQNNNQQNIQFWNEIVQKCSEQGFCLGVEFEEPPEENIL